jgi:serine/threonine-protein kinase
MPPENPLLEPISFGKYTLTRRIGAGGMGEVFLARENAPPGRAVVVKKVLPDFLKNRTFVGRFLDESKVVVRLHHPNVASVYEMGEFNGEYFLAMEYVKGKTVSRFTRRLRDAQKSMPLGLILLIGERVCEGLAYAHDVRDEKGAPLHLVHRDLSPANVCISYAGEVKIIDFGAAQSTLKNEQTAPRVVIGNLTYMAPEQARKQAVDRRADVYSVGVMLWELLSGTLLPQKGDPVERWRRAANPVWEPPSMLNPNVPKDVDRVVLQALSKEREFRWHDARALGEALQALRARYAPNSRDDELGAELALAFAAEKAAEDEALQRTLALQPQTFSEAAIPVPPNALAFEHTMVEAPIGLEEDVVTDPMLVPPPSEGPSRIGFGVSFRRPTDPQGRSLMQEIEALDTGIHSPRHLETTDLIASPTGRGPRRTEALPVQKPREAGPARPWRWVFFGMGLFALAGFVGFLLAYWGLA